MVTIRLRYEQGHLIPLEPLPDVEDGEIVGARIFKMDEDSSFATMLASEEVLRRLWDTPEEDEAWKDL
jgi:hypothetical protein